VANNLNRGKQRSHLRRQRILAHADDAGEMAVVSVLPAADAVADADSVRAIQQVVAFNAPKVESVTPSVDTCDFAPRASQT
jgi:hypothetical protein